MDDIKKLINLFDEIGKLEEKTAKLEWDLYTKKIEDEEPIVDKISEYNDKIFKIATSEEYYNIISGNYDISDLEKRFLNRLKKCYNREKNIPKDIYNELCRNKVLARIKWKEAKEKRDFNIFKPYLKKNIELTKQIYKYNQDNFDNIYDSMLNDYEEGITIKIIEPLFEDIKKELIPIIKKLPPKEIKYTPKLNYKQIIAATEYFLPYLGFDLKRGKIGISASSFEQTVNNNDHRIAIDRSKTAGITLTSIMHEAGHGIFDQNISDKLTKYKNYSINNMALHESQSRFYENIIGRNKNFWMPIIDELNDKLNTNIDIDDLITELNYIYPNYIRCDSDELTYTMHIIIRYEIERDLFLEKIDFDDIEDIWNKKTKEYLGLEIKDINDGLLQDVHWSNANFGYFPMYLIGSIFDGMLLDNINNNLGDINILLKNKEIDKITKYLNNNIHKYGGEYSINEISQMLCNQSLTSTPIINYYKNLVKNDINK